MANFSFELFDFARSALPPISHGIFSATAVSTLPLDSRVAIPFGSAGNTGMPASHPAGSSRVSICLICLARSGNCVS